MQKTFWLFNILLISLLGCNKADEAIDVKVFHYNQPQKITSLDPAFAKSQNNIWAVHHLYNTLVTLGEDLKLKEGLAKKWSISEDGLSYTFILHDSILFHDNKCFNKKEDQSLKASDVVFSFNRIIDNQVNSPGSWVFKGKVKEENPFVAPNDSTVIIHLKSPFLPMLNILSMQYCSVVSEQALKYYGSDYRTNPVGTGPFLFKRWIENQGLYLIRNKSYFEGTTTLDGVRTSFIEDRKVAFLELLQGNVEFVNGLESSFINELLDRNGSLREKHVDNINFFKSPYLNFEYLGINLEALENNPELKNVKVRQALNFAIDKQNMLSSLRNNIGYPADSGVIPKGLPSYNPQNVKGYSFDLAKARKLLAEAGYPNGENFSELVIHTNKDYLDITTFVAKQWERLGIKTTIQLLESASLREGMRKGTIGVFRASWIADYPDGENFLSLFYSGNPAPPRYTRFSNDRFDKLYEQSINETDLGRRSSLYDEMNRILIEKAPVIFLFYDESAWFVSKDITVIETNALNLLHVKQLNEL